MTRETPGGEHHGPEGWRRKHASVVGATLASLMAVIATTGLVAEPAAAATSPLAPATTVQAPRTASAVDVAVAAKARDYLEAIAMSRSSVIDQLGVHGIGADEAATAVDSLGIDWAGQATIAAQEYVEVEQWTRDGLVAQLLADGYATADAVAAVNALTVVWEQQPYDAALKYRGLQEWAQGDLIDRILWLGGDDTVTA